MDVDGKDILDYDGLPIPDNFFKKLVDNGLYNILHLESLSLQNVVDEETDERIIDVAELNRSKRATMKRLVEDCKGLTTIKECRELQYLLSSHLFTHISLVEI